MRALNAALRATSAPTAAVARCRCPLPWAPFLDATPSAPLRSIAANADWRMRRSTPRSAAPAARPQVDGVGAEADEVCYCRLLAAGVAKLADARDSKSRTRTGCKGSIPFSGTNLQGLTHTRLSSV